MTKAIMYLLESSAVLALLYLLYLLLMRKETFFELNRFFLLGILAISALFPLLSFEWMPPSAVVVNQQVEEIGNTREAYYEALSAWTDQVYQGSEGAPAPTNSSLDLRQLVLPGWMVIYGLGVAFLLGRLAWTCGWILRLRRRHPSRTIDGVQVVLLPEKGANQMYFC